MKKMMVIGVCLAASAVPATASKQFTASEAGVRLKGAGKITITNDATSIRATERSGRTVVEVRSSRPAPAPLPAPAPSAVATAVKSARATAVKPAGATAVKRAVRPSAPRGVPASLATIFEEAARRYSLDPVLLTAVARQESRFNARAVSPVGARGVMQLMPRTAASLGVTDSFDARQNIFGGAKYLRALLDQFRGDVNLSLAAYNAGPGAVKKYKGIPPYRETRNYVAAIRRDYERQR